MSVFMIS